MKHFALLNRKQKTHVSRSSGFVFVLRQIRRDRAKFVSSEAFHLLRENKASKTRSLGRSKQIEGFLVTCFEPVFWPQLQNEPLLVSIPLPRELSDTETYPKGYSSIYSICLD